MTSEEIIQQAWNRMASQRQDALNKQFRDTARFRIGYSRTTADGAQHIPRAEVHDEVIEGEFRVVAP